MTLHTSTLAAFTLFTMACSGGTITPPSDGIATDDRAELPDGMDNFSASTDGDGSIDEGETVVAEDIPRLVQELMQDVYDSDCVIGATLMGDFDGSTMSGKALDPSWHTTATYTGTISEDDTWTGEWTGLTDEEVDPNDPVEPEVETGLLEGEIDADAEFFTGTIWLDESTGLDIEGYWIYQSDISGFFFGVAADC